MATLVLHGSETTTLNHNAAGLRPDQRPPGTLKMRAKGAQFPRQSRSSRSLVAELLGVEFRQVIGKAMLRFMVSERVGPCGLGSQITNEPSERAFMRILIIDDDDVARELLSSTLKRADHSVFELATAIGATRAIFEHDIDAVVVDVNLPDISGDKLARLLRHNPRGSRLGIVLVSSLPIEELRALAMVAQADAVLSKSEIRSRLENCVEHACQRRVRVARSC